MRKCVNNMVCSAGEIASSSGCAYEVWIVVASDESGMCKLVHSVDVSCVGKVWDNVVGVVAVCGMMARWGILMV